MLVAQYYGARKLKDLEDTVHTAIVLAGVGGCILIALGYFLADPMLTLMGSPENVRPLSVLYMKIFFLGMPATLVYNFGSAILRAVGDTKRPLYFLLFAGVVNVLLNLFFVIQCSMGVAGVALATAISQTISALLIVRCLLKTEAAYQLKLDRLRITPAKLGAIARIGLPAGMQGAIFSISNVLIQSSLNSFGSVAMAGSTASANIEGFVYTAMNAVYQTALSFTSQNFGARKFGRMTKVLLYCLGIVTAIGVVMGGGAVLFGPQLLGIYSSDPEVITYGMQRLRFVSGPYFVCGLMDTMVGGLRGMGYSVAPMFVSLTGACALRIVWLFTVFVRYRSLGTLYLSYPVTWTVTFLAHVVSYLVIRRRIAKRLAREEAYWQSQAKREQEQNGE